LFLIHRSLIKCLRIITCERFLSNKRNKSNFRQFIKNKNNQLFLVVFLCMLHCFILTLDFSSFLPTRAMTIRPPPSAVAIGQHRPVFAKSRHLDLEKLEIAKAELKRLESASIVRRSKSPWTSLLHMVPQKDGS
jgi:hypothetical protein